MMAEFLKVSIITVVYNNDKTIEDAINSVLSQRYSNIEYIIIDGNSTDNTLPIIKTYMSKIHRCISEKDGGIYDAMNKGVKLATGDIIGILNSDDLYNDTNVIRDVVERFNEKPDLKLLYGDLVYVSSDNVEKVVRKWKSKPYSKKFFKYGNVPPHPALFVKKEVYDQCGLFNIDYRLAADYDFMLRVFMKFGDLSEYTPRLMVRMRLGGATNKNLQNIVNGNKEILKSWEGNSLKPSPFFMPLRIFKRLIQFIQ